MRLFITRFLVRAGRRVALLVMLMLPLLGFGQNLTQANFTGVIVPQFMGSGTSTRLPVMFRATVSGLTASTQYRYFTQGATNSTAGGGTVDFGGTNPGAGNPLLVNTAGTAYASPSSPSLATPGTSCETFTTDATGSYMGWFGFVNTGNARFTAGNTVFPSISLGTGTTVQFRFALNQGITVLAYSTAAGANNGTFFRGASNATPKNLVAVYSNPTGTGRPLAVTVVEDIVIVIASTVPGYNKVAGSYNTIIPNNNPSGVQRVEERSVTTGLVLNCDNDTDGVWPSGASTVDPRGSTTPVVLTSTDTPLNAGCVAPGNPVPTITGLSPGSATAGDPGFTLTVNGTGFVSGSTVTFNGVSRTVTFVSVTQLTVAILAADIATAGTYNVAVTNAAPGGGITTATAASTFTVNPPAATNPVPAINSLSPASATAGAGAQTLAVNGTGFIVASVVSFNGTTRTTTFVSATQLTIGLATADLATAGTYNVTVFNPTPGGGTSAPSTFTVTAPVPAPTITSFTPANGPVGTGVTVTGTDFTGATAVTLNGVSVTPFTVVNATTITFTVPAGATSGTIAVTTPSGTGTSTGTFTVDPTPNPVPTISSLSPNSAFAGGAGFTLTVNGTNFVAGSTVTFNGTGRAASFVSATRLTVAVLAADIATAGSYNVAVTNATPGGGTTAQTAGSTFTVNPAACLAEGFEGVTFPPSGWAAASATRSTAAGDIKNGVGAAVFAANNGTLTTPLTPYPASVSFFLGRSNNASDKTLLVGISISPTGPFTNLATYVNNASQVTGTQLLVPSSSYNQYTLAVPAPFDSNPQVYFQLEKISATTSPWRLDDVAVTCNPAPTPGTITVVNAGTLNAGTTTQGIPGAATPTYTVEGTGLGAIPITVTAPAGFQVSTSPAFSSVTTDANSFALTPTAGTVLTTTVYVRLSGFGTPGILGGSVSNASGSSVTRTVPVTGVLNASPAEINITQGGTSLPTASTFAFASRMVGARGTSVFTIENLGGSVLSLGAFAFTAGTDFAVAGQVPATVPAFGTATFSVRFEPSAVGPSTGTLSIVNGDSNENPYVLNFTGQGLAPSFKTWDGGAAPDNSYFTPANWVGDALPAATDEVLLDHSVVAGAYTVNMDGGTTPTVAVALVSLTVNPGAGPAIELVVPATNTIQDALMLTSSGSDATALAVYSQGKVTNRSGGPNTGSGINITGAGATFFLYHGGTYEHTTARSASDLTDNLSGVGGTENGTFFFNVVPTGAGPRFFTFQNITFGNLTLGAGNTDGYGAAGTTFPAFINGNLTVEAGTFFNLSTQTVTLRGSVVNSGNLKVTSNTLIIGGIVLQTISGTALGLPADASSLGASTTLQLNNPAGLTLATPVTVNGTLQLTNGLINTTATNVLTLAANATVSGGSDASFVNGPVARLTPAGIAAATSYVLPVGKTTFYRPLTLTLTAQTAASTYTAEQLEGDPGQTFGPGLPGTDPLLRVSRFRSFTLASSVTTGGNATGTVTLSFGAGDAVNDPANTGLVVAAGAVTGSPFGNIGRSASTGPSTGPGGAAVVGTLTSASISTLAGAARFVLGATNAITNFGQAINPLPVELTNFQAQRQVDKAVMVRWTTASEKNSAFFEIQRSLSGTEFATVATVAAQGSSSRPTAYAYLDQRAPASRLYYRLRQVDADGTAAYSPVVTVGGPMAELVLYPNPAHSSLSVPGAADTPYRILDQLGRPHQQGTTEAGTGLVPVGQLASGLYLLELQTGTGRVVRKFVKE